MDGKWRTVLGIEDCGKKTSQTQGPCSIIWLLVASGWCFFNPLGLVCGLTGSEGPCIIKLIKLNVFVGWLTLDSLLGTCRNLRNSPCTQEAPRSVVNAVGNSRVQSLTRTTPSNLKSRRTIGVVESKDIGDIQGIFETGVVTVQLLKEILTWNLECREFLIATSKSKEKARWGRGAVRLVCKCDRVFRSPPGSSGAGVQPKAEKARPL